MMNKLIVLVLTLAIAAPVLADDRVAPPQNPETGVGTSWRGDPGSTYSEWTYDDPCNVYNYNYEGPDWPEVTSFVPHPLKEDPPLIDPCTPGYFSGQYWGSHWYTDDEDPCNVFNVGDPCAPAWNDVLPMGRQGGIDFAMGSWDLTNFVHDQPFKDIWVQITYWNGGMDPCGVDFGFGSGYTGDVPGDPCEVPMGFWEGLTDPCDPCSFAYIEAPLAEWDPCDPDPLETWDNSLPHEGEIWIDGERVASQQLGDLWMHDVYAITLPANPDFEWVEGGWAGEVVIIDQMIIETLCYVPEPATMVLLGLGSLLMIRRKR